MQCTLFAHCAVYHNTPKNFHDKILSRISRILQRRESFFREIISQLRMRRELAHIILSSHALLRSTLSFRKTFSRNAAAWHFAKLFRYTVYILGAKLCGLGPRLIEKSCAMCDC